MTPVTPDWPDPVSPTVAIGAHLAGKLTPRHRTKYSGGLTEVPVNCTVAPGDPDSTCPLELTCAQARTYPPIECVFNDAAVTEPFGRLTAA